ncbi:premnaspirodiene oxygenase [Nicotiana tabacum]|uniref:Premnaspirodiene oxygenase n=1 Tax=Nicotiana tabacum TaxID=4097 RepID=A0A1S3ZEJ1_TOBAC|nr:PREDICTED: premnaspirodiene oxygenase-like [Nicotiana tabacum]
MEIYASSVNLVSFLLFFSSLFIIVLVRKWRKSETSSQKQRLPPGPWRLPLIGSLHHLIGAHPHRIFRDLARKYGPVMYLELGEVPTVIISSPSAAKETLKTHDLAFANRPQFTSTYIVMYNNKDIAFSEYGDYWKQMRKICIMELLSARMVKSFSSIRKDEISNLLSSVHSVKGTSEVNMTEKIVRYACFVTCRLVFGKLGKDREVLIDLMKKMLLLAGGDVCDLFPSWKLLYKMTGAKSRLVKMHQVVDSVLENIVNEHIRSRAAGNKGNGEYGGEDLVDVFLRIQENDQLQFPITNDHIKAVIFDMFTAGTETSSTAIVWALSELMKNPNVMAKAQSEVRQAFKGKSSFDEEDLDNLPYLMLVVKETLRLHAPGILHRQCREQTCIGGYTIPSRATVLVNTWAIGRDPEVWHDPESFIPERFENSSIDYMGNHFEFMPFGSGKRSCPGMQFGLANFRYPLARLLYHFNWELPYGTSPKDLDMRQIPGMSVAKEKDLYLIAKNDECLDVVL